MDEETARSIEDELRRARQAIEKGNPGMARVCSRRAAGEAIAALEHARQELHSQMNAMVRLDRLATDDSVPAGIREAAARLRSKLTSEGVRPDSDDPVADAECIIRHMEGQIALTQCGNCKK